MAIFLVWCGTTVKLGDHSFFGHVKRIWQSEETKDLRDGIQKKATSENTDHLVDDMKETAGPVVERVKRGVKAGVKEAASSDPADEVREAAKDAAEPRE
jgi:hypothetical protein